MPRKNLSMMPGFGDLALGIMPNNQRPRVEPGQEGILAAPAPIRANPTPTAANIVPAASGLLTAGQTPAPIAMMPEQVPIRAMQRAATPLPWSISGGLTPEADLNKPAEISLPTQVTRNAPAPLTGIQPAPGAVMAARAGGLPIPTGGPTPEVKPQWDAVQAADLPFWAKQTQLQTPAATPGVQVPMAIQPAPMVPAPKPEAYSGLSFKDLVEAGDEAGANKRLGADEKKAMAGDPEARKRVEEAVSWRRGVTEDKVRTEVETKQTAERWGAEKAMLDDTVQEAEGALKQAEANLKAEKGTEQDVEIARQRHQDAIAARKTALAAKAGKPAGNALGPGIQPAPGPVKPPQTPLEGLLGPMAPSMLSESPEQKANRQAAGRVGADLTAHMSRTADEMMRGKSVLKDKLDETGGYMVDDQGRRVQEEVPDPRFPGIVPPGGKLTTEHLDELRTRLGSRYSPALTGKKQEDMDVVTDAALVDWMIRNRNDPGYQGAIGEWAAANKSTWQRYTRIPATIENTRSRSTPDTAEQRAPAVAEMSRPSMPAALPAEGEQGAGFGDLAAASIRGATFGLLRPGTGGLPGQAPTGGPGKPLPGPAVAPPAAAVQRPGLQVPRQGELPRGEGKPASPDMVTEAIRQTDRGLPKAQRIEAAKNLLRKAGWAVGD